MYSLRITLWKIVTDSETPTENQVPKFNASVMNNVIAAKMVIVAQSYWRENPRDRPKAERMLINLGSFSQYRCLAS